MSSLVAIDHLIRKLRKKLRQIENLERLNRSLTDDEVIKLHSKDFVREKLQSLLEARYEAVENDDRQSEPSTPTKADSYLTETRGDGDKSSGADSSWQGHLEEPHQQVKEKTPTLVTDKSSQNRNRTTQQDQGDTKKQKPKAKKAGPHLSESFCKVSYLEGHNDLITSLVVIGNKLVTASRDTTLKYWDITQGKEIHNYGGHTGTVTSVLVLDHPEEPATPENDKLLISGSLDSTLKLWALNSGQLLRSVYTYNPVVQIAYCFAARGLVTGSDGGKLELWKLASGENMFSACVHNASVTGLKVSNNLVYSSASDGVIKVHQVTEHGHLTCLFVSEDVRTTSGSPLTSRHIRCLALGQDVLFFGDDARNIKVLTWKKGLVSKIPNHTSNFTSTDALCCHDDYLLSSSYDLDEGLGYINIRSSKTLEYLATFDDQDTERIVCLDFGHSSSNSLFVVTGGMDLKLWEVLPAEPVNKSDPSDKQEDIFNLEFRSTLAQSAVDSETDSSSGDDSDSDDDIGDVRARPDLSGGGWTSWCNLL